MSRLAFVMAGALLAASVPAQAGGWIVQGIPGASCATDHRTYGTWEYREHRLLNTDSDQWMIVIATCPVSLFAPGVEPKEYRINLTDPDRRETWCDVYAHDGKLVKTHFMEPGTSGPMSGTLEDSPLAWTSAGLVEMTVHCLLLNKASLDRIEIVWWKP
jgi:hypothetical protein